ncbi:MAG: TlpA disulfide reductase family protein [Wenzhouxiangella sp.]|jgi:thiol-disulfide isomerase/thioredoxin|nr:TlpA disulfide reductase family protein [Wenzhouxiangella sp.]
MRAGLFAGFLLLCSTAYADCRPEEAVVAFIEATYDRPCMGFDGCWDEPLGKARQLLEQHPTSMPLHRVHQYLEIAARYQQREIVRAELAEHYRDHPDLTPEARRYLIARLEYDEAGLREAARTIPWARLDLMRRPPDRDGELLVDSTEAEQLAKEFVSACPDAGSLLVAEASQLAVHGRWPVWGEVRRELLAKKPPDWERLDSLLIGAGLLQEVDGDPAAALLAELSAITGDAERETAEYWLYRARIHLFARDIDAAIEANARARSIDLCQQLSPMQRIRSEANEGERADWLAGVSEQVISCDPEMELYQGWMFAVSQSPELLDRESLARIRRAIEAQSFDFPTPGLRASLARIDICCSGEDVQSAWATLDEEHERSLSHVESIEPGIHRASTAFSVALDALNLARLALKHDFPEQVDLWTARADALMDSHLDTLQQHPDWEHLYEFAVGFRSESRWIQASKAGRHGDAVVYALEARARRQPWVDMDEVFASWQAAGGTEAGFEQLLSAWDLGLPAQWRGWRRLQEPLADFELTDLDNRTWTQADIDGKRTLINLWAMWCGPCLLELPKVQELHERYRDNSDVQVLTINIDDAAGVARELMRREGYDFPVLLIKDREQTAFDGFGIPRNWLIDSSRTRQWEQTGFVLEEADHWVDDIVSLLARME